MNDAMFSSGKNDWTTPQWLFDKLDEEFHFTLDPCCYPETAKCAKYYTEKEDGLKQDWTDEIVFCNPPYSDREQNDWVRKCYEHGKNGGVAVMLIPARTDTKRFHDYIYGKAEIRFLKGRLKFGNSKNSAPFPSMVVIFGKENLKERKQSVNVINAFPGYSYENGKNMYRGIDIGRGGYVYGKPGIYEDVALLDIASMHPTSAICMNYFGEYTPRFKDLKDARVYIKERNYEPVRHMFDGKLVRYLEDESTADDLAQALKIAINSVYGLTSASFVNPFRDSRNINNIVALRGALFMKTLQDHLTDLGYNVIAIRTDSIKIANATQEAIDICMNMAEEYGYEFEHECTYDRICLVNDSVYIAKYDSHGIRNKGGRHAGEWTATGAQFQQGYVFKKLFSKEEITFDDVCETKEVKAVMYLDMNEHFPEDLDPEAAHNFHFVGRVGRFCPIKPGRGGGELLVKRDDKFSAVTGTKGYRWLESEVVKQLSKEDDIDLSYYHRLVDEAIETISKFGDFEAFVGENEYVGITT